ncbi:MAG: ATP-binding cassette domain-containing protein [Actinomycetota bacterium]|nr:ATP-binding cassette domain-containing protein [Actinomycetota bacterium]
MVNIKDNIICLENIVKDFRRSNFSASGKLRALSNINLNLGYGETLGIVGESGCGKSTLGKIIVSLEKQTEGKLYYKGIDLSSYSRNEFRIYRKEVQMIFQNISASLNPRKKIGSLLKTPMLINKIESIANIKNKVMSLLEEVGLDENTYYRWPSELSGGQQQRIGICRALSMKPKILVADEPTSALDVSVQAQIIRLLKQLKKEYGFSLIFISHDLAVVKNISDKVAVIYLGQIVEQAQTNELFSNPCHPYTKVLLSSIPTTNPNKKSERLKIDGEIKEVHDRKICPFYDRCFLKKDICGIKNPEFREVNDNHMVKCHI